MTKYEIAVDKIKENLKNGEYNKLEGMYLFDIDIENLTSEYEKYIESLEDELGDCEDNLEVCKESDCCDECECFE